MITSYLAHEVGLERIDALRREAEAWRSVKLARAELDQSPSTTLGEQPPGTTTKLLSAPRVSHSPEEES